MTSPLAFRISVDERLRKEVAASGRPINRARTLLIMERFLARVVELAPEALVLKGGLALELRLDRARTTRDVDMRAFGSPEAIPELLARVAATRPVPEDFIDFRVEANRHRPEIDGEGVRYTGRRFVITPTLASKPFGDPFGLDIAFADPMLGRPDILEGSSFFVRYGLSPLRIPAYPMPTHIAEKLHAYTLPRTTLNTRVKDLVDIAILAGVDGHASADLAEAIRLTFTFRGSHAVPGALPEPPAAWHAPYDRMRREEALPWRSINDVSAEAGAFLNPVLAGIDGRWVVAIGVWR